MGALLAGLVVLLFLGSLRQTLVIVLAIPLATLVAMTLMGLFGLSLKVFSLGGLALGVGIVLLIGIVVNNAIVLVERANQIRDRESLSPRTAILQASTQRLRPILMTTITTVLGLLPLAVKEGGGAALPTATPRSRCVFRLIPGDPFDVVYCAVFLYAFSSRSILGNQPHKLFLAQLQNSPRQLFSLFKLLIHISHFVAVQFNPTPLYLFTGFTAALTQSSGTHQIENRHGKFHLRQGEFWNVISGPRCTGH